jgi:TolB-like protein
MRFKGHNQTLPEIAQQLGVDFIIEGSIVRADDGLRVTAQLIDAHLDEHVWSRSYERSVRNVLAVQAEVAATIADEVREMLLSRAPTLPAHD